MDRLADQTECTRMLEPMPMPVDPAIEELECIKQ